MTNNRTERSARAEKMRKERQKSDRQQRNFITIVIVGVVAVLVGLGGWAITSAAQENRANTEVIAPQNMIASGVDYPADEGLANPDAPLVEIFEDFLCPACGQFEATEGEVLKERAAAGEIRLRFKPFSFLHNSSTNDYSRRSTNLAMCAVDDDGADAFWKVHSTLYANQPAEGGAGPEDKELLSLAKSAGVNVPEACVRTERFVPWIDQVQLRDQNERGIQGTPVVFIDGKEFGGTSLQAELDSVIADAQK